MNKLIYIPNGDVTSPIGDDNKIICHVVNDANKMGSGVAKALFLKWPEVRSEYITKGNIKPHELGEVQFVPVEIDILVANIVGQHDVFFQDGLPPVRYDAIREGLKKVFVRAKEINASIHCPPLGAGLAGGEWSIIEKILIEELVNNGVSVIVYNKFNMDLKSS
jgi:O-acetyl-ADP-ribose deacetylase (regulator of RNase III)